MRSEFGPNNSRQGDARNNRVTGTFRKQSPPTPQKGVYTLNLPMADANKVLGVAIGQVK